VVLNIKRKNVLNHETFYKKKILLIRAIHQCSFSMILGLIYAAYLGTVQGWTTTALFAVSGSGMNNVSELSFEGQLALSNTTFRRVMVRFYGFRQSWWAFFLDIVS